jgi:ABC-type uncharacterized transport system YnjBCD ATPase subunit
LKWFSSKEKPFIKDLNIKVNNGKILTIFGSSGIGKSSLINVIAGVYESNLLFTGDIILNNKKITNTLPEKRKIGLLLQDGVLFPHLSVEQNLIFGIKKSLTNKEKYLLINEHLIKANMDFTDSDQNTLDRHFYTMISYSKKLNDDWSAHPSVLVKTTSLNNQVDANINFKLKNKLWFGTSYRQDFGPTIYVGIDFGKLLSVYSFDISTNEVADYSSGSHEFTLGYDFIPDLEEEVKNIDKEELLNDREDAKMKKTQDTEFVKGLMLLDIYSKAIERTTPQR